MKKERFVSLRIKLTIGIILICFVVGLLAILSVSRIASSIIDKEYGDKAEQITQALADTLDPADVKEITDAVMSIYYGMDEIVPSSEWGSDEWNAYMANYKDIEDMPVFIKLRDHFRKYQDIYNVDCFYITVYKPEILNAIYIVDGAPDEEACPPGCVDAFDDGVWPETDASPISATITNEGVYGWLVSAGYPLFYEGEPVAHLDVDISMDDIKAKERGYVVTTILAILGITILAIIVSLLYFNRGVIRPIAILSNTAKNYCSEKTNVVHNAFEKLQIDTHDEISELLSSMKQMEADMNTNISTLFDTKMALRETEEKASTMEALAVKDALTGIRNKTAYDHEVDSLEAELAGGLTEFGLAMVDLNFLKKTNDTYGHEKGNISIKTLCGIVCDIFEHSPVFRVGGDEFVVVLKGRDYQDIDRLIESFNNYLAGLQKNTSLDPWEQISAAIGYAKFDRNTDSTVEDVFKKADKAMYDCKLAMKAERKD